MSKKLKLSPIFSGKEKPEHVGPYLREYRKNTWFYCNWDGDNFSFANDTPEQAATNNAISADQNLPWRGVMK